MTAAERAAAIASHLGAKPVATREIVGQGAVNHVVVVTLAGGARWVVRFVRNPLDSGHYAVEAWCMAAAARAELPVAELVGVGRFEGTPFLVQSYVAGESGDTRRSPELWRTLGTYARRVNEIPLDASAPEELFGRFGRDPAASWAAHVRYNLGQLGADDPLLGLGVYEQASQAKLRACFDSLADRVTRFGLTHGDVVPRNALLPPGGEPILIDWGSAQVGPVPYLDYLRVSANALASERFTPSDLAAFAEGYGVAADDLRATMADVRLLSRIDLVRWALDRRPDRVAEIAEASRHAVRSWLNLRP